MSVSFSRIIGSPEGEYELTLGAPIFLTVYFEAIFVSGRLRLEAEDEVVEKCRTTCAIRGCEILSGPVEGRNGARIASERSWRCRWPDQGWRIDRGK